MKKPNKAKAMNTVNKGPAGFIAFTAWIGALVYFVGQVDGFWNIIVAFFKACVWPAYLIYHVFQILRI